MQQLAVITKPKEHNKLRFYCGQLDLLSMELQEEGVVIMNGRRVCKSSKHSIHFEIKFQRSSFEIREICGENPFLLPPKNLLFLNVNFP